MSVTTERTTSRLSSVTTAVRLLKMFSEGEAEIGVTSLSRRLGVAKSTVYRLASTLVAEGMLEQNPETEKYRLGIALFALGALVRQRMDLSNEGRPYIFDLREATNETVHLAVLDQSEIMYVYDLESTQAIRMRANLGARRPALCTAEGRAILAFHPPELVEPLLREGFRPRTPKTETEPDVLRARCNACPTRRWRAMRRWSSRPPLSFPSGSGIKPGLPSEPGESRPCKPDPGEGIHVETQSDARLLEL